MILSEYNAFCGSLEAANHVVQWRGAHVWKVGARVFAIARPDASKPLAITFKCSQMAYELLKRQPGLGPAPYFASRGMSWIEHRSSESMPDEALRDYIRESHRLAALNLTKEARAELGLAAKARPRP